MRFNVNNIVRVKLTDFGRQILHENHEKLFGHMEPPFPFTPHAEDAEGWSTWQMWSLMADIGPWLSLGEDQPIETEIEIVEDQ